MWQFKMCWVYLSSFVCLKNLQTLYNKTSISVNLFLQKKDTLFLIILSSKVCIYTAPPPRTVYDTRPIFKKQVWIQSFPFPGLVVLLFTIGGDEVEKKWIHVFTKGISRKWKANSLVQDSNSGSWFLFLTAIIVTLNVPPKVYLSFC